MKYNNIKISPQLTIEQRFAELLKQNKKKSTTIYPQAEDNETILKSTQKILATLENAGIKYRWYHYIYETKSIKEVKNFLKSIASEKPEVIANIADLKEITSRYKFNKFDDKVFFASKYIESQEKSKQETQVKPKIVTNIEFAEILDALKINDSEERFSATLEIIDKNKLSYIGRENFLDSDFDKIINKNDDLNFSKSTIAEKFIKNSPKNNENSDLPIFIDFINKTNICGSNRRNLERSVTHFLKAKTDQNQNLTLNDGDISSLIKGIKADDRDKISIATKILESQLKYEDTEDLRRILKIIKHLKDESILSPNPTKEIRDILFFSSPSFGKSYRQSASAITSFILSNFDNLEQSIQDIHNAKDIEHLKLNFPHLKDINLLNLSKELTKKVKPIEKASDEIIDKITIKNIDDQKQKELKDILKKFLKKDITDKDIEDKDIEDKDIETLKEIFTANIETYYITKFKNFMIKNIDKVCFLLTEDKEGSFDKFNGIISTLEDGCGANISNRLNMVINSLNTPNTVVDNYAEPIRLITVKIIEDIITLINEEYDKGTDVLGGNPKANIMQEDFLANHYIALDDLFDKILSIVNYNQDIDLLDKTEYSAIKEYLSEQVDAKGDYSAIEPETKKLIVFELMKEIFNDPKQQPEKQNYKFDSLILDSSKLKAVQKTIAEANQRKEKENLVKDQEMTPNNNINPSSPAFNRHEKLLVASGGRDAI